jgi:eukaryotic-like serine/threonine-protein kinase
VASALRPDQISSAVDGEALGWVLSGRYRIVRAIGSGALGRVYEVEQVQVSRRFAVKVLKPEHRKSAQILERFRHEAKVGGKLNSPHTVAIFDYDVDRGAPYFVMEYLEGCTLQELLSRDGSLSPPRAVALVSRACRGTRAAHEIGVLHRDLKPSNLFIGRSEAGEWCKVLDFGVAKRDRELTSSSAGPSTSTGAIVGTLAYMSPEQLRGDADLDERADVYSLGAILYECLAGVRPFDAPTPPALMYRILEEDPKPLAVIRPQLPVELVRCVQQAMRRSRHERFDNVLAFEQALANAVATGGPDPNGETQITSSGVLSSPLVHSSRKRATSPATAGLRIVLAAVLMMLGVLVGRELPSRVDTGGVPSGAKLPPARVTSPAEGSPPPLASSEPPARRNEVPPQPRNAAPELASSVPAHGKPRRPSQPSARPSGRLPPSPSFDALNPYAH